MSEEKKQEEKKQEYYDVVVETLMPVHLYYNILAYSPEEAIEKTKYIQPSRPPKNIMSQMRRLCVKVYDSGTTWLRTTKRFG